MWCNIECCCGVISVCLPTLGPIIQWILRREVFGYQPVPVAIPIERNTASRSSRFLQRRSRRESKSQPYDKLELRPWSPPRAGIEERWITMFARRKSVTDEPLSTWALNLEVAILKRRREHRSVSEPIQFPSPIHAGPRSAGRGA